MKYAISELDLDPSYTTPDLMHSTKSGAVVIVLQMEAWHYWAVMILEGDTVVRRVEVRSRTRKRAMRLGQRWIRELDRAFDSRIKMMLPRRRFWEKQRPDAEPPTFE